MRKIVIIIGIVVLVIVVAVGVVFATFDPNDYRGTIQTKLESPRIPVSGMLALLLRPLRNPASHRCPPAASVKRSGK